MTENPGKILRIESLHHEERHLLLLTTEFHYEMFVVMYDIFSFHSDVCVSLPSSGLKCNYNKNPHKLDQIYIFF